MTFLDVSVTGTLCISTYLQLPTLSAKRKLPPIMLRDALKSLVGADAKPSSYQQQQFYPSPGPPAGDNYGYQGPGPPDGTGPHDFVAAAQAMVNNSKNEKWRVRFGHYRERKAREKADKMFGLMIAASKGDEGSVSSAVQITINKGKVRIRNMSTSTDCNEKRAKKKARKLSLILDFQE